MVLDRKPTLVCMVKGNFMALGIISFIQKAVEGIRMQLEYRGKDMSRRGECRGET